MIQTAACQSVPVLVVGESAASPLISELERHGHPLRRLAATEIDDGSAARDSAVAVVSPDTGDDVMSIADRLHDGNRDLRVVLLTNARTIDCEEAAAQREFLRLQRSEEPVENIHKLVHDVLAPLPDAEPKALRGVPRGRLT